MRARRREVVDEYVEDGRAAVYSQEGLVLLLSELGTQVWGALAEGWVTADEVTAVLVRELGEPAEGDAGELTAAALQSLADLHLAEVDEGAPA
jgi:hypothetical protein